MICVHFNIFQCEVAPSVEAAAQGPKGLFFFRQETAVLHTKRGNMGKSNNGGGAHLHSFVRIDHYESFRHIFLGGLQAMGKINEQVRPSEVQTIMQQFEKQSQMLDMKEEMISEGIDAAFEDDLVDGETEAVMDQILDEIGVNLSNKVSCCTLMSYVLCAAGPLSFAGSQPCAICRSVNCSC